MWQSRCMSGICVRQLSVRASRRIGRFVGHKVIGDVHLGDWGLQMGLIITEVKERQPELVYFDESYEGEYPEEAPFTISELEEIYPTASGKSKVDEAFREAGAGGDCKAAERCARLSCAVAADS